MTKPLLDARDAGRAGHALDGQVDGADRRDGQVGGGARVVGCHSSDFRGVTA